MICRVHLDPRVEKQLAVLRRASKKADIAAQRAEQIVLRLKQGILTPEDVGTVTKHGELRIKGCMKYDLGSGYRLITLKHGRDLFVLYCGTHDDSHRWIENNRELRLEHIKIRSQSHAVGTMDHKKNQIQDGSPDPDEVIAEDFDTTIDEKILRQVFCGLIGNDTSPEYSNQMF